MLASHRAERGRRQRIRLRPLRRSAPVEVKRPSGERDDSDEDDRTDSRNDSGQSVGQMLGRDEGRRHEEERAFEHADQHLERMRYHQLLPCRLNRNPWPTLPSSYI
jgi:hypothetical protein